MGSETTTEAVCNNSSTSFCCSFPVSRPSDNRTSGNTPSPIAQTTRCQRAGCSLGLSFLVAAAAKVAKEKAAAKAASTAVVADEHDSYEALVREAGY